VSNKLVVYILCSTAW